MFRWIFQRVMAPDTDGGNGGGSGNGDGDNGDGGDGNGAAGDDGKTILGSGDNKGGGDGNGNGDGDTVEWSWGEEVPGTGTVPPWLKSDKYKTVADQAKAAVELEEKLGPAAELIGAPEGDYEVPALPEGVVGKFDLDDPMLKQFMVTAKEMGLSQKAFDTVAQSMASLLANEEAEAETQLTDALAALGTNSPARIEAVDNYLIGAVGKEAWESLQNAIGTDVKAYLVVESLVAKASGDAQLAHLGGKGGVGFTKADIEAEEYKLYPKDHKLAGKSIYEHDKEHRAKVDNMWKELFPGEDRTEVG